jgi:hypothetical protein
MLKIALLVLLAFLAGAVAGYLGLVLAVTTYWEIARVHDQDGGGAMALAFVIGPVFAVVAGAAAALLTGIWATRRAGRRSEG